MFKNSQENQSQKESKLNILKKSRMKHLPLKMYLGIRKKAIKKMSQQNIHDIKVE